MKNIWVRFGCFLTGYNYGIVRNSSEMAAKAVKKYTAAIVIVCILWFFIGFVFAQRYLKLGIPASTLGGFISVVIIVQIERQIILSLNPSRWLYVARLCLALMMAILGAVIIDQILFKDDIELEKIAYISERVDKILPSKTAELKSQIADLDTTINSKEVERSRYTDEVKLHPTIKSTITQRNTTPIPIKYTNSGGGDSVVIVQRPTTSVLESTIPNPTESLIAPTDSLIAKLRSQKAEKENSLLNIKPALEKQMTDKTGFLDELKVMWRLITGSGVALGFWLLWIFFFLFIEMLVLLSKWGEKSDDYAATVMHHMNLQIKRLDALAKNHERTS